MYCLIKGRVQSLSGQMRALYQIDSQLFVEGPPTDTVLCSLKDLDRDFEKLAARAWLILHSKLPIEDPPVN